jgi:dTDP-D-glucose 4,6-dehydratase
MDKLDYCATLNNLNSVKGLDNFRFVKGDIQSMDLVSHVLEKENVDTIMHFAAQVCPSAHELHALTCTP